VFAFAAALLVLAAVACGGGSDNTKPIGEDEAAEAVNAYLVTSFGLFTGQTTAKDFIAAYAPECRGEVSESDLATILLFIQALAPELAGTKIDAIDVGQVKVEKADGGYLVAPDDPGSMRVKVDGQFVNADEYFTSAGFQSDLSGDEVDPILFVRRDGKIYAGDCQELQDFVGGGQ
jgi:hypothetical protein